MIYIKANIIIIILKIYNININNKFKSSKLLYPKILSITSLKCSLLNLTKINLKTSNWKMFLKMTTELK